jgi:hypothetical protein
VQVAKVSGRPRNPVFHDYYQRKITEGKTKKQALVCVMRRLVNIVYGETRAPDGLRHAGAAGAGGCLTKVAASAKDAATMLVVYVVVPE